MQKMTNSNISEISKEKCFCKNEFAPLKKVLTAPPLHMQIDEAINETQKFYIRENIDRVEARRQYSYFIQVLQEEVVEVIELPVKKSLPEQVFTRDTGFVIGGKLFISSMAENIRKGETAILKKWLKDHNIYYRQLPSKMEGGDIIVEEDTLWIGMSDRTSHQTIKSLKKELPDYTINTVELDSNVLHLDCVFNTVDRDTAIVYPPAINPDSYRLLRRKFDLIEVTSDEQFHMGPNVLSIGNKTVISLPENKQLNRKLRSSGFHVREIPFSEIIKSGGSFRCCTLPLVRK